MASIRFTGQIVKHAQTGQKGQIVRVQPTALGLQSLSVKSIDLESKFTARLTRLIVIWEKSIVPEYYPALSEDIKPVVDTNKPFYFLLNYLERIKFIPIVFDLYQRKKRSDRTPLTIPF